MGDKTQGIYNKFRIERTDGTHRPGKKHHGCQYFVLDLDHDPHAKAALQAYSASCRADYPLLSNDLVQLIVECDFGSSGNGDGSHG